MKALVTGCAGFVGSTLVDELLAHGWAVVGIDRFTGTYDRTDKASNVAGARSHEAFSLLEADLVDAPLAELLAGADVVFHLAGEPGVRASWGQRFDDYAHNNVSATQRLLEALIGLPNVRLVYASSSSIYGQALALPTVETTTPQPHSPYGVTKLAAEHLCELYRANFDVDSVSLRYFSVYGARQRPDMAFHRFCRAILEDKPIRVLGDGHQGRDFTHVSDVVAATIAASSAEAPSRIYNIGGGAMASVNECVSILRAASGRDISVQHEATMHGDVRTTRADTSRAREELEFAPSVALEDGLAMQFAWFRERYESNRMGNHHPAGRHAPSPR